MKHPKDSTLLQWRFLIIKRLQRTCIATNYTLHWWRLSLFCDQLLLRIQVNKLSSLSGIITIIATNISSMEFWKKNMHKLYEYQSTGNDPIGDHDWTWIMKNRTFRIPSYLRCFTRFHTSHHLIYWYGRLLNLRGYGRIPKVHLRNFEPLKCGHEWSREPSELCLISKVFFFLKRTKWSWIPSSWPSFQKNFIQC